MCGAYPLLGRVEAATKSGAEVFFCAIGNNRARQAVTARALALGLKPITLIDPSAVVAPGVIIGAGGYVGIGSVVSVGSKIGDGILINHQACVGHDVTMGDFSQVCPGVCVSGGCLIGEGALLGTNAGVIPLKKIGAWATVGAGTTALRDIADGTTLIRMGSR
jgi:sugar O-acyltransferase (sialic acid O-acetyltransferase NeuD family)